MRSIIQKAAIVALLAVSWVAHAAEGTHRVLIPTLYEGPGAFGTTWSSIAFITNLTHAPLVTPGVQFLVICPIPEGCTTPDVLPEETGSINAPRPAEGLLLYAAADQRRDLLITVRIGAAPRRLRTEGTDLPIGRETDFSTVPIRLHRVPVNPSSVRPHRATLRVYGPDAIDGMQVRMELRPALFPAVPPQITATLTLHAAPSPPIATRPIFPAFAQLDLTSGVATEEQRGFYDIQLTPLPLPDGTIPKIWAFVSITDNETNEVTIIRAQ